VRNEEELQGVKEARNILQRIKRRKSNCLDHILLMNCLQKHVIEGNMEGRTGRRGRKHKQLLDGVKKLEDTEN
jgi:hypothetical protein